MSEKKPSFIKRLRGFLPPTERAMAQREKELNKRIDEVISMLHSINGELRLNSSDLKDRITANSSQNKLLLWELYRNDGEDLDTAKRRFFYSLPKAKDQLRILQLANAKLLHDFKEFCAANDISFFLVAGTLLGAVRHGGFIPWDDDLDTGMLRDDLERLEKAVAKDPRYTLSVAYDQWVYCKQVRFMYADSSIPCFVDVFYFDYAPDLSLAHNTKFKSIRSKLAKAMAELDQSYLEENNLLEPNDEVKVIPSGKLYSAKLEEAIEEAIESALAADVFCSKEGARYLRWGLENIANGEPPNLPIDAVFPLSEIEFEGEKYPAPNNAEEVLRCWFGDWLDLPNDLYTHFAHTQLDEQTIAVLSNLKNEG